MVHRAYTFSGRPMEAPLSWGRCSVRRWPDAADGRTDVRFAYSADKGKTWSRPMRLNDDRPPTDDTRGPDHMMPTIAVNQAGVVLVVWYDRRDSRDNMSWKIRAAASLDG